MYLRQLFNYWTLQVFAPGKLLRLKYEAFKELLRHDKKSLELITDLDEILHGGVQVDWARIDSLVRALRWSVGSMIRSLLAMHPPAYQGLEDRFHHLESSIMETGLPEGDTLPPYTLTLSAAADAPELAGGKACTLGWLFRETGLPGPRGFVVTTRSFHRFLQYNHLRHRLDELLAQVRLDDWERLSGLSQEMESMIREGELPPEVTGEIANRLDDCRRQGLLGPWVLRSSALCEDGEASFAGQYSSILRVPSEEVFAAYKEVLASKYSPRAVAYRIRSGLADQETPMAVLILELIDPAVSGVVYTREPRSTETGENCLVIYAIPGLGGRLMDGSAISEVHYLSRQAPPRLIETVASPYCVMQAGHGCLSPEAALTLAKWGMALEKTAGGPQDLEWCQDKEGRLFLLQSRPLNLSRDYSEEFQEPVEVIDNSHPVLLQGGVTASPGLGMGQVCLVNHEKELGGVPPGAVLVAPTLTPAFAVIIDRLQAAVADGGSRASHFAAVARECGLPVMVGTLEATRRLTPGQMVTVDASHCRIYLGQVDSLKKYATGVAVPLDTPFSRRLRKMMAFISPLHLTDPASADFSPQGCRSLHDVVRFAHEKGMTEMFSLVGRSGRGLAQARRLATDLPLVMYILDLEGGLSPRAKEGKTIDPQLIACEPMRAWWEGLSHPDVVWHKGLVHLDWEELDRLSAGLINIRGKTLASYAIISKNYLHLTLRFGYHFAVLDTLCSQEAEANYITFRFKGGGGDFEKRLWRIRLIKMVLEWAGFVVRTRGDLLDARLERQDARQLLPRLSLLGLLHGKISLLDIALANEDQAFSLAQDFQQRYGRYVNNI
ncbi:MAG: PEP/pyruvate-binding domain-containing protein [Thermodesulfobacteriota bacterium]